MDQTKSKKKFIDFTEKDDEEKAKRIKEIKDWAKKD